MHNKLVEILKAKQEEIAALKKAGRSTPIGVALKDPRDFEGALKKPSGIDLIAEIKFGSPSAGAIGNDSNPFSIGKAYEAAGAACISLLTDRRFFKGDLNNLPKLKPEVSLPILRKDFILDEVQIEESALFGADAILLIARILELEQLKRLLDVSRDHGLSVLTEIHDQVDLDKALHCDARIIGINNRDLDTFEINLNTTVQLAPLIPKDRLIISESGIRTPGDLRMLKVLPLDGVLVGSALMGAPDPGQMARAMVEAGRRQAG